MKEGFPDLELCPEGLTGRFLLVGLLGMKSGSAGSYLPLTMLPYLAEDAGIETFVLFDGDRLQEMGETGEPSDITPGDLDKAAHEMRLELEAHARAVGRTDENFSIMNASSVCACDPRRFKAIYDEVLKALSEDSWLADKIWKIVPPSAKIPAGFDTRADFASLPSGDERQKAIEIMKYEVVRIAFDLFSQGQEVTHGRNGHRTRQMLDHLKETRFLDWKGSVDESPELKVPTLFPGEYRSPYSVSSVSDAEGVVFAILRDKQIPLLATLRLANAMRYLVANGATERLCAHLRAVLMDPLVRDSVLALDFANPDQLVLAATTIMSSVIWPVERESIRSAGEERMQAKVLDALSDFSLLPNMKVILEDLMPTFCGDWQRGNLRESLEFLIGHLDGEGGPIAALPVLCERTAMTAVLGVLKDIYAMLGGEIESLAGSASTWFPEVLQIDAVFGEGKFGQALANGGLARPEERDEALDGLLGAKAGIVLADGMSSSFAMTRYAGNPLYDMRVRDGDISGLGQPARRLLMQNVIFPYLRAHGVSAVEFLVSFDEEQALRAYSELRAGELGMTVSGSVLATCAAMGELLDIPKAVGCSGLGGVIEQMREIAAMVCVTSGMRVAA